MKEAKVVEYLGFLAKSSNRNYTVKEDETRRSKKVYTKFVRFCCKGISTPNDTY